MTHIDPNALGVSWNHTVDVRGVQIPLLSPLEANADEGGSLPRGLLNLHKRLWAWLHRLLWGRPLLEHAANGIAQTWPEEYRHMAAKLTGGEVLQLHAIYTGLQREWYAAISRAASAKAPSAEAAAPAPAPSHRGGQQAPAPVRFPLIPGRPLPQFMGGYQWGRDKTDDSVIVGT